VSWIASAKALFGGGEAGSHAIVKLPHSPPAASTAIRYSEPLLGLSITLPNPKRTSVVTGSSVVPATT
jgi:hypothetical protein